MPLAAVLWPTGPRGFGVTISLRLVLFPNSKIVVEAVCLMLGYRHYRFYMEGFSYNQPEIWVIKPFFPGRQHGIMERHNGIMLKYLDSGVNGCEAHFNIC